MCEFYKSLHPFKKEASLVSDVISGFVEPVGLFPAGVKAHGPFVLQQIVDAACPVGWPPFETLLLGVTDWRDGQSEEEEEAAGLVR